MSSNLIGTYVAACLLCLCTSALGEEASRERVVHSESWREEVLFDQDTSIVQFVPQQVLNQYPWGTNSEESFERLGLTAEHAARLVDTFSQYHTFLAPRGNQGCLPAPIGEYRWLLPELASVFKFRGNLLVATIVDRIPGLDLPRSTTSTRVILRVDRVLRNGAGGEPPGFLYFFERGGTITFDDFRLCQLPDQGTREELGAIGKRLLVHGHVQAGGFLANSYRFPVLGDRVHIPDYYSTMKERGMWLSIDSLEAETSVEANPEKSQNGGEF